MTGVAIIKFVFGNQENNYVGYRELFAAGAATGAIPAPTVDNDGGASNITINSAILDGTLTSTGGAPVTLYFFYGTNDGGAAWGAWAYTNNIGGLGSTGLPVICTNVVTTGLGPGTNYFYRFYATNSAGADLGDACNELLDGAERACGAGCDKLHTRRALWRIGRRRQARRIT